MEDIAEVSSNPVGFAVLRLLRKFPDRKYLDMQNEGGLSVIHFAALHSNIHALKSSTTTSSSRINTLTQILLPATAPYPSTESDSSKTLLS
jgi:hypothetical protein